MTKETKTKEFDIDIDEMTKAGLHFGQRTSRTHPKMIPYVSGIKNYIHVFDLEKTKEKLKEALKFIQELISENKTLLIIGTKVQIKNQVKETAQELNLPYVSERWLGGTFTNFGTIAKRIEYYKGLEQKKSSGELEKYTKKERLKIDKELKELELKFGGIKSLTGLPAAIFVCDMLKDELAIKEAAQKGIKIISICDTNVNPASADFPIPANDDAVSSVKYILEKVKEAVKSVKPKKATA